MPERKTMERARKDKREGKSVSTQAGEFVREEIDHSYERSLADYVLDGCFELYKTSAKHERDTGRKQHGFPSQEEVAL
jgi:hypothetical protein